MPTYYPGVATPPVDEPPCDLPSGLDDQQAAEALEQLEDGARVAQAVVPPSEGEVLQHAALAEEPLVPAVGVFGGGPDVTEGPGDPVRGASIDGETAERPDEEARKDDPLEGAEDIGQGPAHP